MLVYAERERADEVGQASTAVGQVEEDRGFVGWVEALAGELYEVGYGLGEVEEPDGYERDRDFLLSGDGLGGEEGFGGVLPGLYLHGRYHGYDRKAGEDLLSAVWRLAWEEPDGDDCRLRVISVCDPHRDEGEVVGLDLTGREGFPHGTLLFHEWPCMADLVCHSEAELRDLYRWAWRI